MATVGFVLAAVVVAAAVGVGAFLLAVAVTAPAMEATAAYLRWREAKREKRTA